MILGDAAQLACLRAATVRVHPRTTSNSSTLCRSMALTSAADIVDAVEAVPPLEAAAAAAGDHETMVEVLQVAQMSPTVRVHVSYLSLPCAMHAGLST